MNSFKNMTLALAFGLLSTACGDDSNSNGSKADAGANKPDGGEEKPDASGGGADGSTGATACIGSFAGYDSEQVFAKVTDKAGKCASAGDVKGVCAGDVSSQAKIEGKQCFEAGAPMVGSCTSERLGMKYPTISASCLSCYAASVECSAKNCPGECLTSDEMCTTCREKKLCTAAFFTCSGLPTPMALGASK